MPPPRAPPGREVLGSNPRIDPIWGREQGTETRTALLPDLDSPTPDPSRATGRGAESALDPLSPPSGSGSSGWATGGERSPKTPPWREGWTRFKWAADFVLTAARAADTLATVGIARPGPGAPDSVTVGSPHQAAFCAWPCYLGLVIRAPVWLLDVRKVTQPLVFHFSPRTLKLGYN